MTLKEALKHIEALEKRVRELEARPPVEHHHHHYALVTPYQAPMGPVWTPTPPVMPPYNTITCAAPPMLPFSFSN